jgi:hypothetical protein
MRPQAYQDSEVQPFNPMEHPDNVTLDVTPPLATADGVPIPEVLIDDDPELAGVDIDAIAPGADEVVPPLLRTGGF